MERRPDCNQFHVAFVIVSAELVCELKDNYFGDTVIFTVMHAVVLKNTAVCCLAYLCGANLNYVSAFSLFLCSMFLSFLQP